MAFTWQQIRRRRRRRRVMRRVTVDYLTPHMSCKQRCVLPATHHTSLCHVLVAKAPGTVPVSTPSLLSCPRWYRLKSISPCRCRRTLILYPGRRLFLTRGERPLLQSELTHTTKFILVDTMSPFMEAPRHSDRQTFEAQALVVDQISVLTMERTVATDATYLTLSTCLTLSWTPTGVGR